MEIIHSETDRGEKAAMRDSSATAATIAGLTDAALRNEWHSSSRACGDARAHLLGAELLRRGLKFCAPSRRAS